ncbi:P-loop NTPase fold protein [Caballeronia sp. LjRoot31]|uniref:P-loop NTPase fold protein n=1 Tax=Caballeronia sp. LjRoot31 TaxID=3342324 RepID=UPI003ED024D5
MASGLHSNEQRKVFLLYNEREAGIEDISERLQSLGIPTYYFRRDIKAGDELEKIEELELREALAVVAVLGAQGWGQTQRKLAERAVSLGKHIIPALVGPAPDVALDDIESLFRRRLRVDLRQGDTAYEQLRAALLLVAADEPSTTPANEQSGVTPRFDEIFNVIVDGSEIDRTALLDRVIRGDIANREELAVRIRKSIGDEYSVALASQFGGPPREQARIASIRGWLLSVLIWLEADSVASGTLILRHIHSEHEPDRTIRFWTLAGIIRRDPSYRKRAQEEAREDNAPEVAALASVADNPKDASLLLRLRTSMHSADYETAWCVLRVLRVFPVPDLAPDVVELLERKAGGKPLTYDALYALALPEMAFAAMPILATRFGVRRFSELVLNEARSATPLSRRPFGQLLSIFDSNDVRDALLGLASESDREIVNRLLSDMSEARKIEAPFGPLIAGYASDTIDISQDDIGISRDVETLASVMLAREVTPPLAIGLFGEWGAGKSFFMRSISAAVDRIAGKAKAQDNGQFCSDVVQIHFNAWHYVDTSLLASLVSNILDELSSYLTPKLDPSEAHANLTRELESVRAEVKVAEAERNLAAGQLREASQALQVSIVERERRELKLRDLRYGDLAKLLNGDDALKTEVEKALSQVGAPAAIDSINELSRVVEQSYSIGGRAASLIVSIFTGRSVPWMVGGIALLFILPPAVAWVTERFVAPSAAALSALAAQVTVILGSTSLVIGKALGRAKTALNALSEAKRKVDERLAKKRSEPTDAEIKLESELTQAKATEQAAVERVAVVSARAKGLEDRVTATQQGRSLSYFVAERARSEDYRQHLGLISVVRKDFDGLVQRLRTGQEGLRHVDRIVLYIDDVDRCPPDVVVEILQAVHLLLAYELFVVVVSVDPRWLLRSLEAKFSHLKNEGPVVGSFATAQDYLDKIFQIPFSVRPMNGSAFARMMQRLLAPTKALPSATSDTGQDGERGARLDGVPDHIAAEVSLDATQSRSSTLASARENEVEALRDLTQLAQALSINKAEAAFAGGLYGLLSTPRSAKRFANVYRLLKASVPPRSLAAFEGTAEVPGIFQVPMLLLAALIGDSSSASATFPMFLLQATADDEKWWIDKVGATENEGVARMLKTIDSVAGRELFPHDTKVICEWLPRVARYSFLTARMFLDNR